MVFIKTVMKQCCFMTVLRYKIKKRFHFKLLFVKIN